MARIYLRRPGWNRLASRPKAVANAGPADLGFSDCRGRLGRQRLVV